MKHFFPATLCLAAASGALVPAARATLATYDAAIASDNAGPLPYTAVLTSSVSFNGTNAAPFDFGPVSGSATVEFILYGDPSVTRDGYLAVGANGTWNLRYEQWDNTGTLGFTHLGVADYVYGAPSPIAPTHIAYRWDGAAMDLYVDGVFSQSIAAPGFEMPTGAGQLGNNFALGEGMVGTIDRVTVYNDALTPAQIANHANAWLIPEPAGMSLLGLTGLAMLARRRR